MDQPRSHITPREIAAPCLALPRKRNIPGVFPHPRLSFRLAALLKGRYWKFREQGNNSMAGALALLAASAAAASLERECERRNRGAGDYLRPTIDALFWRDPELQRLHREDPEQAHKLPSFRCAARHESTWRACIVVEILSELARMTAHPDGRAVAKVAERARAAGKEWRTAEALRAVGHPDDAAEHTALASKHLLEARVLARRWTPDRDELLRVTSWRLMRHFGFRGPRIAAALVSAALDLDKPISARRTRYVIESANRRAIS
jgi:hypothetical protein